MLVRPTLSFAVWILYTASLGFVLWNDGISSLGVSGAFLGGLIVLGGRPAGAVFLGKWIALIGVTGALYIKVTCLVLAGLGGSVVLTAVIYIRIILRRIATRNTTQSFHNNLFFFIVAALRLGIFFRMCVF